MVFIGLVAVAVWFAQRDPTPSAPAREPSPAPAPEPVAKPKTIFQAADTGDVEALTTLLDVQSERVHQLDESGWTPLHHAAYRDHPEAMALLLARGADVNAVAVGECVPIHMAATEASPEAIDLLAAAGADLNYPDDTGITALHYATLPGRHEVVKALVRNKAALNMKDAKQETALDLARRLESTELAAFLEQEGGKSGSEIRMRDVLPLLPDGPAKTLVPRAWHLEMESEEMTAAITKAKDTLPKFLSHLAEQPDARAAVKFAVRGEGIIEYVWGEVLEAGSPLMVEVTTPPVAVPAPEHPTPVEHDAVVDWQLKLDEDRTAGGYSQRATFEAIREEYGFLPPSTETELSQLVDL